MKYKLDDICKIGSSKRIYLSEYKKSGIPFYRGKEIIEKSNNQQTSSELYISKERYLEIKDKFEVPHKGDILLSAVGTLGKSWFVDEEEFYFKDGNLIWLSNFNNQIVNNKYLFYKLNSKWFKNLIESISIGSTQKAITIDSLKKTEILLPELDEQYKIVKILDVMNGKIKNNIETNNNLQEIIRSLYIEKFSNKRYNGKIEDILKLKKDNIKVKDIDDTLNYYPIDTLPMNYLVLKEGKSIKEANSSLQKFLKYDILLGSMRVYFHRVCLASNDGITRNTTFVMMPIQDIHLYYCLLTLDKNDFIDYASKTSKGSTMPYAVWEAIAKYEVYIPTKDELEDFNRAVSVSLEKMMSNECENENLIKLRDTLLPKLMNGEIDLENIEI